MFLVFLLGGTGVLVEEFYHRKPRVQKSYEYVNPRLIWESENAEYIEVKTRYTYHIQTTREGWFTYKKDTLKITHTTL